MNLISLDLRGAVMVGHFSFRAANGMEEKRNGQRERELDQPSEVGWVEGEEGTTATTDSVIGH